MQVETHLGTDKAYNFLNLLFIKHYFVRLTGSQIAHRIYVV